MKVPDCAHDEQVLFLSDIFPTGYMAAENCNIQPGDTVPSGAADRSDNSRSAARSCWARRSDRDRHGARAPGRLAAPPAPQTLDFKKDDIYDRMKELTEGSGADACIDAVGTSRRPRRRRFMWIASRWPPLWTPIGHGFGRRSTLPQGRHGLHCRRVWWVSRQDPVRRGVQQGLDLQDGPDAGSALPAELLERIEKGEIDPSFVITHRAPPRAGPDLYKIFRDKKDGCIKVVLKP